LAAGLQDGLALREDARFYMMQNLEANARRYLVWQAILITAARYLAAHSPNSRARHQTAEVARRVMRSGAVHQEVEELVT